MLALSVVLVIGLVLIGRRLWDDLSDAMPQLLADDEAGVHTRLLA